MDSFTKFSLYRNVEEILEDLSKHEDIPSVKELIEIYNQAKIKYDEQKQEAKHPLIVLEGLDGCGKTSMSKTVSKKVNAKRWVTPPESVKFLREYFDNSSTLRTAYYSLGNYIAALEVACVLHETPVLMDRFWHSTTAFAIGQAVVDRPNELQLPETSDEIYKWPVDLLKPNIVILLTVSEEARLERQSRRTVVTEQEKLLNDDLIFRERVIQAYKTMRDPGVTLVDGDGSFGKTKFLLLNIIRPLLNN